MSQNATKSESNLQTLPIPVTASADSNVARRNGQIAVERRSSAAIFVAISVGLAAVFPNDTRATLLFVGASVVIGVSFVVLPVIDDDTCPIATAVLQRLPDVLIALAGTLIVLGLTFAFPDVALIPLFAFVFLAVLPALSGMILITGPRAIAVIYGISLVSLLIFVVLASAI